MLCLLFVSIELLLEGDNAMSHYRAALKIISTHSQNKTQLSEAISRGVARSVVGEEPHPIYLPTQRIELIDACKR